MHLNLNQKKKRATKSGLEHKDASRSKPLKKAASKSGLDLDESKSKNLRGLKRKANKNPVDAKDPKRQKNE